MVKKLDLDKLMIRPETVAELAAQNQNTQLDVLDANFKGVQATEAGAEKMANSNAKLLDALKKFGKI